MSPPRPAGLPRAPAGVAAIVALAAAAPLLDGRGLLVAGADPGPGAATALRAAGLACALGALVALARRRTGGADGSAPPADGTRAAGAGDPTGSRDDADPGTSGGGTGSPGARTGGGAGGAGRALRPRHRLGPPAGGRSGLREAPAALGIAGAVAGTLALLTLPVSDVALDWPPPADPAALPPSPDPSTAGGGAGGSAAPPPVLRLPAGGGLDVRGDVLLLELPDGSTFELGQTGGGGAAALPAAPQLQLEVGPGGGITVTDGAGTPLADLPPGGGDLDLGDVRIEDAGGGGLVDVAGGAVTDAGGAASGQVDLLPTPPDRAGQDLAATVAGVLLAGTAYYLVFLHGRLRPRRPALLEPEAVPVPDPPVEDPVAAGAGLAATLEAMLLDPDPRTAIVAAYARMLDVLGAAGYPRRPQEAPHEHLRRVLQPLGARPGPVHDLADLFVLARFGDAPLLDAHRDAAITALRASVDDLRAVVPA